MGCCCSTSSSNTTKERNEKTNPSFDDIQNENEKNEPEVDLLRKTLKEDIETFILNQLLISVMFFYEYYKTANNKIDPKVDGKQIILPDAILQNVGHLITKERKTPSRRMYINYNFIQFENEVSNSVEPLYKAKMEISKQHEGFVLLEMLDYYDDKLKIPYNALAEPSTSTDIKYDSENDYATLFATKTPQQVRFIDEDIYTHSTKLPTKCVTLVSKDTEKNYYLNSREFMDYFKTNAFPNHLGNALKFPPKSIKDITSIDGSVFCNDGKGHIYEIFPSIGIAWPNSISVEWKKRVQRNQKPWLNENECTNVVNLNCVLTAKGFVPKKHENQYKDIEWEIEFPQAEKFLELKMHSFQKRMYTLLMILYHRYLENESNKVGLLINHIRHFMFWECEEDRNDWSETSFGSKLIEMLKKLSKHLRNSELKHYFIPDINLFENFPCKHVFELLDKLAILKEHLIEHILHAVMDVTETQKYKFNLDLNTLRKILYSDFIENILVIGNINHSNLKKENMKAEPKNDDIITDINTSMISIQQKFENNELLTVQMIKYFIRRLVEIAQMSTKDQVSMYLKHAEFLARVCEDYGSPNEVEEIKKITDLLTRESVR